MKWSDQYLRLSVSLLNQLDVEKIGYQQPCQKPPDRRSPPQLLTPNSGDSEVQVPHD